MNVVFIRNQKVVLPSLKQTAAQYERKCLPQVLTKNDCPIEKNDSTEI